MTIFYFSGWEGHFWSKPDEKYLRKLLHQIYENPKEAKKKGKIARKCMEDTFSLKSFGEQLDEHFIRIIESEKFKSRRYKKIIFLLFIYCHFFVFLSSFFHFCLFYFRFSIFSIKIKVIADNVYCIALFVMTYLIYIAK